MVPGGENTMNMAHLPGREGRDIIIFYNDNEELGTVLKNEGHQPDEVVAIYDVTAISGDLDVQLPRKVGR